MDAPGDGRPPTSAWKFLSLPVSPQQRKSYAGSTPEQTSSYVHPCSLESVQWPSGAPTQPLESKKAMDNLSLSLLSPELQAGVGEGHEGGLQLGKERAGPSLIKATLVISPSGGPREEGLGFRAGCSTLYQNAIKLIPIMLIITHRIAGTLGRCDSVWNAGVAATLTP